jgi:hypothetical protein
MQHIDFPLLLGESPAPLFKSATISEGTRLVVFNASGHRCFGMHESLVSLSDRPKLFSAAALTLLIEIPIHLGLSGPELSYAYVIMLFQVIPRSGPLSIHFHSLIHIRYSSYFAPPIRCPFSCIVFQSPLIHGSFPLL